MTNISASLLWDIFKHARSWLANLNRASEDRKQQSITALRNIISASRETAVYIRQMNDNGSRDHVTEKQLSLLWTDLSFSLDDLGIHTLAKRCNIKGKQWANPDHYDADFINKADVSLDRMERLAQEILLELKR
jgi:hypothetical protein